MADHINVSDEEDDSENNCFQTPELQGVLNKWTNYIHGWQSRFIVLKDGTLSYYKSEHETGFGCRGAISLYKATLKVGQYFGMIQPKTKTCKLENVIYRILYHTYVVCM